MRLDYELDARLLKIKTEFIYSWVETVEEADGIIFLCPKCYIKNDGVVGTHSILCWKTHVPQTMTPRPGRWKMIGTNIHDLTLEPSIDLNIGENPACDAHFFIRNGEIIF